MSNRNFSRLFLTWSLNTIILAVKEMPHNCTFGDRINKVGRNAVHLHLSYQNPLILSFSVFCAERYINKLFV
ncbi:unnamed protein product [Onchocerca flexuosa]|uniref:Secreted protein n=1 Tax=Onchocerca flexuosa TaxID=387005 RepID=A0A183HYC0_9BILA|nr:unnamed protein product [Onchocerca flexuosa]